MDRLVYWIYRLLGAAVRPLSLPAAFRLGQGLGLIGYWIAIPYRRLALHNLEIAFGGEKTAEERRIIARDHFRGLVGNLLAGLKIAHLSREQILALVTIEGWEHAGRLIALKRPIVSAVSHIGNWELIAQLTPILFPPPVGTIYQRLGNRFIDAEMRASRARQGLRLFERKEGFQGAIQTLREGSGIGVLVDQHAGDGGVWCPLSGRLASTSPLAATLALRTNAVLLPMAVYTTAPGRWKMVVEPPIESAGEEANTLTAAINAALETQIRRQPADWLWGHNRWKTPRPKFLLGTYKRGIIAADGAAGEAPLKPFRILIRSSNWLGDAVMSVPAVRAIKRGRPDARVSILTPAKLADVWKAVQEVDEVIAIPAGRNVFAVSGLIQGRFDVAILFPNSLRVALEAWLAGIPRRVGFPGHRRKWLLNQVYREKKKKTPAAPEHQVRHYLRLAAFIGAEIGGASEADDFASPRLAPPTRQTTRIAVCPGAEYGPAKRWLPERFAEVMTSVNCSREVEWLLVGVRKDEPIGAEIAGGFTGQLRNLIGQTTLEELMHELRACDLLLTNDTGTMHLAALLGVPVVAIFGSTEPALTGPLGNGHRVLRHHVSCSPCFLRDCPIDFRCMKEVPVTEVVAAITELIEARMEGAVAAKRS